VAIPNLKLACNSIYNVFIYIVYNSRSSNNSVVYNGNAAQSNEWVCSRSLAGIAGSNPAGSMDVSLL
jgi:hypothetical protein